MHLRAWLRFVRVFAGQTTKSCDDDVVLANRTRAPARRRSGLAIAAALLLLFALGVLLLDVRERGLRLGSGLLLLMLGVAAVGLLWGSRVGYWTGVVMTALLAVFVVLTLADAGLDAGGVIVAAVGVAPLLLLLPPAARRSFKEDAAERPAPEASPAPVDADETPTDDPARGFTWPQGWTKPLARGWPRFGFMILVSVLITLAGLGLIGASQGADRWIAGAMVLFGFICGFGAMLFRPTDRPGWGQTRLRLERVELDGRQERGVAFPYSRLRTTAAFFITGAMALAIVGLALGELSSDGSGWWPPWLAALGGLMLIAAVYLGARKGMGRRWRVVLTPSVVVFVQGNDRTVVPWEAIERVRARESTVYIRGFPVREPFIELVVDDRDAITTGTVDRALLAVNQAFGWDFTLPVRALAVDPVLLYSTLRRYHQDPGARPRLGNDGPLQSVRIGGSSQAG